MKEEYVVKLYASTFCHFLALSITEGNPKSKML